MIRLVTRVEPKVLGHRRLPGQGSFGESRGLIEAELDGPAEGLAASARWPAVTLTGTATGNGHSYHY